MLLALADSFRCTEPHADTWLVARADAVEDRRMVRGVLGCPICHAEREVRGGVVYWTPRPEATPSAAADTAGDALIRVGALIAFAESLHPFVLCGSDALAAHGLSGLGAATLVLLDPPDDRAAPFATIVRGAPRLPLAARSVQGIAADTEWAASSAFNESANVLVDGGRLVAPASVPVPPGIRELARDTAQWVGERAGDVVPLARAKAR